MRQYTPTCVIVVKMNTTYDLIVIFFVIVPVKFILHITKLIIFCENLAADINEFERLPDIPRLG